MYFSEAQPTLETERLILRPFDLADASRVRQLAGDERIAEVTANIPHPYPDGLAESWISRHAEKWRQNELAAFAIVLKRSNILIGCISAMHINFGASEAELGYWIGVEYWNNGFCTEACKTVVEFCFFLLNLKRIHAHHLSKNPASGRVLIKSGLLHIGSGVAECGYRGRKESVEFYEKYKLGAPIESVAEEKLL